MLDALVRVHSRPVLPTSTVARKPASPSQTSDTLPFHPPLPLSLSLFLFVNVVAHLSALLDVDPVRPLVFCHATAWDRDPAWLYLDFCQFSIALVACLDLVLTLPLSEYVETGLNN